MNLDSPKTSDENYLLDSSVLRFVEDGPATINELLHLVFTEAHKLKSILNYTARTIRWLNKEGSGIFLAGNWRSPGVVPPEFVRHDCRGNVDLHLVAAHQLTIVGPPQNRQ